MHIFYNISRNNFYSILDEALLDPNVKLKLDELDCSKSWSRQDTNKTLEEIISISKNDTDSHYSFIHRKNPVNEFLEIGLRTDENQIGYFIWVYLPIDRLDSYINKYNLIKK